MVESMYIANLAMLLNSSTGTSKDEVENELMTIMFQNKVETHYDRSMGGDFRMIEQSTDQESVIIFLFFANMIESVYRRNMERSFEPFIAVGSDDLQIDRAVDGRLVIYMEWKILQNLAKGGSLEYTI